MGVPLLFVAEGFDGAKRKLETRKQKAEGRRQKAEGRRGTYS